MFRTGLPRPLVTVVADYVDGDVRYSDDGPASRGVIADAMYFLTRSKHFVRTRVWPHLAPKHIPTAFVKMLVEQGTLSAAEHMTVLRSFV